MIDFTNFPVRNKTYAGANGSKISVVYDGELYMLKFPAVPGINKNMSYANGCISEYLGCHIFESIGIPVQKTLLGTYTKNGKEKIVVACKDFTAEGLVLQDFASLKNTMIDSAHNGYGTELSDIVRTLEEQAAIDPQVLSDWFWDMFIVDALIGNWDRHNGNWGFLYNSTTDATAQSAALTNEGLKIITLDENDTFTGDEEMVNVCIATRKDDTELHDKIQAAMDALKLIGKNMLFCFRQSQRLMNWQMKENIMIFINALQGVLQKKTHLLHIC